MRSRSLTILAALTVAACAESSSEPDSTFDVIDLDVAMVAADGALSDLAAQAELIQSMEGDRSFERTATRTFYDANGNEQDAYDPLTTARIVRTVEMSREASREGWSASVSRSIEQEITGLEGEETERTVNGSGSEEVARSRHDDTNGTRSYEMSGTVSWNDVVHGVPREDNPYPLSGSITRSITVVITNGPNGDETRQRTAVITFNGTQFATMTVDGETFEVDLSTRSGRSPFRGRGSGS